MSEMKTIQKRVYLDLDLCIGCKSCSAACFYGHRFYPAIAYGELTEGIVPLICRQCEEPACVEACPVEALKKDDDGIVQRSRQLCIGCRSCVMACPFGVIASDLAEKQSAKCDMCADRVREGQVPRCVAACSTGALSFTEVEGLEADRLLLLSGRAAGQHPLKRR